MNLKLTPSDLQSKGLGYDTLVTGNAYKPICL